MEERPTTRIHLLCHITSIINRNNRSIMAIIHSLITTISSSRATILAIHPEPSECDQATKPQATTISRTTIVAATAAYRTTAVGIRIWMANSSSNLRVHGHRISLDGTPGGEKMTWTEPAAEPCTAAEVEAFGLT